MILRPARDSDLDDLVALAHQAGVGMTNFPPDAEVLAAKIHQSTLSFGSPPHQPEGELYILGLEEPGAGRVVGVAAIIASVGLERP
ncbi:MAG: arginine N-succinyltransferase, partial [Candidatus Competibacterales bacterium]